MRKLSVVLALLVLVVAGCSDGDSSGSGSSSGGTEAPPISLQGTTNNHGTSTAANDMEIELDDFYFAPTFVKAKASEKITVELHNEGQVAHTFTSNALGNLDEELAPGARKKVTITASAGGAAVFYCRFHQAQGMQGAIFIG